MNLLRHDTIRRRHSAVLAAVTWLLAASLITVAGSTSVAAQAGPDAQNLPHTIIPAPASVDLSPTETFTIADATQIVVDDGDTEAARIGRYLASIIGNTVDTAPTVVEAGAAGSGPHIRLTRGGEEGAADDESYNLEIQPETVTLTAPAPAGLFYGVQTIRQLLPGYVEYGAAYYRPLTIPVGQIADAPRFAWRGAMLDVSRHFFPPEDVKRYLDLMALHKLNRLHLHLSDDQGWRIEIPSRPRLTSHGASTEVGGGPSGFFTTEEWLDLVRYAEDHFITLVPEIDMPGHTNAALASYPELTCDGVAPELYTGTSVGFSYLCVENELTYAFVEDVVRDIAAVTPGPYFHLGGDEVHELTHEQYVQFMERAQAIVEEYGKRVVGWDEIAEVDLDLVDGAIVQVWRPQTEGTAEAVAAAVSEGASVVLSPADRIYLDMKYDSTTVLGLSWAGYSDVRNAYEWEPAEHIPGVPESSILGVEAPLWSESLDTMSDVEYMAFPQLAGVAEMGWSPADARDWDTYRLRLGAQGPRWTALGINFFRTPDVPWQYLEE